MNKNEGNPADTEPIIPEGTEPVPLYLLDDEALNRLCQAKASKGFCPSKPDTKKAG